MAHLMPPVKAKFYDSNGNVLASGKIYTYQAGTSTPLATYTDETEGGTNANPVVLDANGEAVIWLGSSAYKIVVEDSLGNTVATYDNVQPINTGYITAAMCANGFLTADSAGRAKMADSYVTQAKLQDGILTADTSGRAKMNDSFVNTAKLSDASVTTAKIVDANVTTAKLVDNAVTTVKITDANVTTAKIADSAITTAKINAKAITQAKRADLGQVAAASSGTFTSSSTTGATVTNQNITITSTGRPVQLLFQSDGSGQYSYVGVTHGSGTAQGTIKFTRDDVGEIARMQFGGTSNDLQVSPSAFSFIDYTAAAGAHSYTVIAFVGDSTDSIQVHYSLLVAYEL